MSVPVVVLLGSDSDAESFGPAFGRLRELEIPFAVEVTSAHRTPARTVELIRRFEGQGARVFIAAAGGAAHLPGVVASHTLLPVLGVPIASPLLGLDSLLSMAQMPGGIPVATFGIGASGALNAVLFAAAMLAHGDAALRGKLEAFRTEQRAMVERKSQSLQRKLAE